MELCRLKRAKPIPGSDIPPPVLVGKVLEEHTDLSEMRRIGPAQLLLDLCKQAVGLGGRDGAFGKQPDGAVNPLCRLGWQQLKHRQQDATTVSKAVARERNHHAGERLLNESLSLCKEQVLDNLLKLLTGGTKVAVRRGGVRAAVGQEVTDVMKRSRNGFLLFQGQRRDGSLEDWSQKAGRDESGRVVEESVDEETVKVLDDVREIIRRNVAHGTQHIRRLGLEKGVDVVCNALLHILPVLGELAENRTGSPEEAALVRLGEALSQLVGERAK